MAKMSSFMIGIVLVGLFAIITVGLMADLSSEYDITYTNSTALTEMNKLNNISDKMQEIEVATTSLKSDSSILDIVGALLTNGYSTLLLSKDIMSYFFNMLTSLGDEMSFKNSGIIISAITTIVLITIIIGIFISVLVKREV